jgi:hypothetical protein
LNFPIRYRISILLSAVGFSLWLYVIVSTSVWWIDTSYEFGLFQQLPVFYWIGLLVYVGGVLLLFDNRSQRIFLCQILVLGIMIWGTPVFVENNARITDSWWHLGTAKTILDSGRITVNNAATHEYLEWPGSFVFSSIVLSVSGLPPELYMRIFPLFSSTIFVLVYYVCVQKIVENKIVQKLSIMALFFLNLWLEFHLSPQAFGLMLFPLMLVSLMKGTTHWNLIALVLFFSLVISHPLSPFFMILFSVTTTALSYVQKKKTNLHVVFFLILSWLGWFMFNATQSFSLTVLQAATSILNFEEVRGTTEALVTARASYVPSLTRLVTIACTMAVALLYIISSRKQEPARKFTLYVGWILAFFLFFSYDLIFNYSTLQDRAFMFVFLLIPILVAEFAWKLANARIDIRIVAAMLLLLLLPNLLTLYYNERALIVSDSNIKMVLHLNNYFSQGGLYVYGSGHLDVIFAFNNSYNYLTLYYQGNKLPVDSFIVFDEFTMQTSAARGSSNMRYLFEICSERVGANLLYDSGPFEIYYSGPSS